MDTPIDIDTLRRNLGYNCEMERRLLMDFIRSSQELLDALSCAPEDMTGEAYSEQWENGIRHIKDAARNIGAAKLAEMAGRAEHQSHAASAVKQHLLELVDREFRDTERFIRTVIGHDA